MVKHTVCNLYTLGVNIFFSACKENGSMKVYSTSDGKSERIPMLTVC